MLTRQFNIGCTVLFFLLIFYPIITYSQIIPETTDTLTVQPGEKVSMNKSVSLGSFMYTPNISYQTSGNNMLPSMVNYVKKGMTLSEFMGYYSANVKFDLYISSTAAPGSYVGYVYYEFYNGYSKVAAHKYNFVFNIGTNSTPEPVADFSADKTNGTVPLTVQFSDQSTGEITNWEWDFGDDESSSLQNPAHTYLSEGDYTVVLTVTGPGGSDTRTRTNYIAATTPETEVNLSADTTVNIGDSFTVDVIVKNVTNLGSFQFDLEYLTNVIQATAAELGDFLGSTGRTVTAVGPEMDNTSEVGIITFGGFSFGNVNGPDGSGVLATLNFETIATGVSTLSLRNLQLTDTDGNVATVHNSINSTVEVTEKQAVVDPDNTLTEAAPDSIPADGESTSIITVIPKDSLGNRLAAGQYVELSTSAGTLLNTVTDHGDGTYTQLLQSSASPETAIVTATVNGIEITRKLEIVFTSKAALSIRFQPTDTTATIGEAVNVKVMIDNVKNMGSFQFDVSYLTTVVHANDAWLGDFLSSSGRSASPIGPVIDNSPDTGKVTFGGFSFGSNPGPDDDGELASIQFTVQNIGITELVLTNVQITDVDGGQLEIGTVGTATISSIIDDVTAESKTSLPDKIILFQNHPNPFNPETTIHYQLPQSGNVCLNIFNLNGQLITTLISQQQAAGFYSQSWNGRDDVGNVVPSGVYFFQLKAQLESSGENYVETRKMVLVR